MGRKLSFTGLAGSGGGGGGVGGVYSGTFLLDMKQFDWEDQSKSFQVTDMHNYAQSVRIRGLDTSTKAYAGMNSMIKNGTWSGSGTMQHGFGLFSANQTTGAIVRENMTVMHNNPSSPSDYSTFVSSADEWTGQYTYVGHYPCNGQQHVYSWATALLYNTSGGNDFDVTTYSSGYRYYPQGNKRMSNQYVELAQRKIGGKSRQVCDTYYQTNSYATALGFYFGDSSTSRNMSHTNETSGQFSGTSTNYPVQQFPQLENATEPYYDCFHSFQEGLMGRIRTSTSWNNLGASYTIGSKWRAFYLSNGSVVVSDGGTHLFVNASGTVSAIAASNMPIPIGVTSHVSGNTMAWNVGTDEWLTILPDGNAMKFKFDPSNGYGTISNTLQTPVAVAMYDDRYHFTNGFWSRFAASSVNYGGHMATFGNENSTGHGFGKSKLLWMGQETNAKKAALATYEISGLVAALSYP